MAASCIGHEARRELATTAYLSNRLRQLAASYLVHDLAFDWRAGAAWFESQLGLRRGQQPGHARETPGRPASTSPPIEPAPALAHVAPGLAGGQRSVLAVLSANVGSVGDNRLGRFRHTIRILLTGGTGLIGRTLCQHWQRQGHALWRADRDSQKIRRISCTH